MKRFFLIVMLFLISSLYAIDELWEKTELIVENSQDLIPKISVQTLKMNFKDKGNMFFECKYNHRYSEEKNKIENEHISSSVYFIDEDDTILEHDNPEDFSSLALMGKEESDIRTYQQEIFSVIDSMSKEREVKNLNEYKEIDGQEYSAYSVVYSSTGKKKDRKYYKIWLNTTTGSPYIIESKPLKSSFFAKDVSSKYLFSYHEPTNKVSLDSVDMKSIISFLVYKVESYVKFDFFDYWELN